MVLDFFLWRISIYPFRDKYVKIYEKKQQLFVYRTYYSA